MAVLKKLNLETGQYEEMNVSFGGESILSLKDTVGIESAYKIARLEDVATEIIENRTAVGHTYEGMTRYKLENISQGDVITNLLRNYNGDTSAIWYDGTTSYAYGNLPNSVTESFENYAIASCTWVADKDYEVLYVASNTKILENYPSYYTTWSFIPSELQKLPTFNNEFVPTINDEESSTLKTLSSKKIYNLLGKSEMKAKENLQGGVWIALGDSYTVYADSHFKTIAEKYGIIYDGQGKVSSTVCGDECGNKGFSPFWNRMNGFISNYTGNGQVIGEATYKAEDVKLITFMGGANDGFGKDTWLGSHTSMDTNYIYGACNYIFRKLQENFPNAQIICILQPSNYSDKMEYDSDETAQTLGFKNLAELQTWDIYSFGQYKMETKERAVKECAERFGIPIVDCIFDWYSVVNPMHRSKYWNTDKIHLSSLGSQELANKLELEIVKQCGRV